MADELSLCIPTGKVLDEEMEAWLDVLGGFDPLDPIAKEMLNTILVAEKHAPEGGLNAKQVSRLLKNRLREEHQNRGEDEFYQ